ALLLASSAPSSACSACRLDGGRRCERPSSGEESVFIGHSLAPRPSRCGARPVDPSRWPRVAFAASAARRCRRHCAVVCPRRTIRRRRRWGDDEKARVGRIQRGAVSRRATRIGQHRAGVTSRPSPIVGRHPGRRGRLASARRCGRHGGGVCSQARSLETAYDRDGAILRLRSFVDALVTHAAEVCRGYQTSADRLIGIEVRAAQADRVSATDRQGLHLARAELRGRAIAARAAADAAIGAASALAIYIREGLGALPASAVEPRQLLLFGATGVRPWKPEPSWNVAPSQSVTVVGRDGERDRRVLTLMHWGLLPPWEKVPELAKVRPINARCETIASSKLFRRAFQQRRCLVPVDCWFEWQKVSGQKLPHALARADRQPVALGGIWECWRGPVGDRALTLAIVTTSAT